MLRYLPVVILSLFSFNSFGQISKADLSAINTLDEAEAFLEKNPKANAEILELHSARDTTSFYLPFFNKKPGDVFNIAGYNYKILQLDSMAAFRVSYIYLNGEQYSKAEIDSVRNEIIAKFKNGTSFSQLAAQYTMDMNKTGDTNWFTENMMVKGFEDAVKIHKKGDIFTVDTPDRNWYHVVLKTFDDSFIKTLTVLKVKK